MTAEELQAHRDSARAALSRGRGGWRFSAEALAEAGAGAGPPFAVVAAATVDRRVGRFWPVRAYPWGRCESLLAAHSDLPALRRLLFGAQGQHRGAVPAVPPPGGQGARQPRF